MIIILIAFYVKCARQGFAAALTTVLAVIPIIRVSSVMRLIVGSLEISSSMKGQVSFIPICVDDKIIFIFPSFVKVSDFGILGSKR